MGSTLGGNAAKCAAWSSYESFSTIYENFLSWDISMPDNIKPPDHVFYFTIRDSSNFGIPESFGLIGGDDPKEWCDVTTCKITDSNTPTSRQCAAHPKCAGLMAYLCCPTVEGVMLDCCNQAD